MTENAPVVIIFFQTYPTAEINKFRDIYLFIFNLVTIMFIFQFLTCYEL